MNLKRPLRGSETGADVRMVQRALNRWAHPRVGIPESGKYDLRTSDRMMAFQAERDIKPASGDMGQATLDVLWRFFDAYGRWRYRTFVVPKPKPPELIEPAQGFFSLHQSLWEPYSILRRSFLSTDLGTHNPKSTLPSGGPSDHSVLPAYAFDVGFRPWAGWWNLAARKGFWKMAKHPAVEYVILGDKIHTKSGGLQHYSSGGHLNHIHVSGHR